MPKFVVRHELISMSLLQCQGHVGDQLYDEAKEEHGKVMGMQWVSLCR